MPGKRTAINWGIKKAQSLEGAGRGAGPARWWRVRGRGLAPCY
jgi:hypothetical protein